MIEQEQQGAQPREDTFEISLRILGNEIIGMRLASASRMRNWAVFGILALAAILAITGEFLPDIITALE